MGLFTVNRFRPSVESNVAKEDKKDIIDQLKRKAALKLPVSDEKEPKEYMSSKKDGEPKDEKILVPELDEEGLEKLAKTAEDENDDEVSANEAVVEEDFELQVQDLEPAFTLLGEVATKKQKPVKRVLPYWLTRPSVISSNLLNKDLPVESIPGLNKIIVSNLKKNGINYFFPVQQHVIPRLLDYDSPFIPNDLCVSAPTGSGKTLAFVLPMVQNLSHFNVKRVRALVILPVHDLAVQVYKVFSHYVDGSNVKVALISGYTSFMAERESLVRENKLGQTYSLVDVVVATPGRLVDHIEKTVGFDLTDLRYLIIDEADRILEETHSDWLTHIESAVYKKGRTKIQALTIKAMQCINPPLQKLLFSATLTSNPEKLKALKLFQPELYTSVTTTQVDNEPDDKFIGRYTTPEELTEYYCVSDSTLKPLVVQHLVLTNGWKSVLCFHSSRVSTHRLSVLLNSLGRLKAGELSADLSKQDRVKMIEEFKSGKIQILVSTDAMARGMDLGVEAVISYDPPLFPKNYIHRVGRTARAGKPGTAVTILLENQLSSFETLMAAVKNTNVLQVHIEQNELFPYEEEFKTALEEVRNQLTEEEESKKKSILMKRKGSKQHDNMSKFKKRKVS
ncbi:ATP-dependent RNA helicase DDX51-like [Artemia franciscana]|uniref:ATP-dependent RNA helicase n=1 Tax=Artemia franciscana TaxID=6661 RepID=A0AA88LFI8_ARTSF|nr:hypothetical protein QYM36_005236 [Artemia franciscana]